MVKTVEILALDELETVLDSLQNCEIVKVTFGNLFQSLYDSYQLVKDDKEALKQWADNSILVFQGDVK